jgi:hypothetical protein
MNTTEVLAGRKVCKDESVDRKNGEVKRERWQEKRGGGGAGRNCRQNGKINIMSSV